MAQRADRIDQVPPVRRRVRHRERVAVERELHQELDLHAHAHTHTHTHTHTPRRGERVRIERIWVSPPARPTTIKNVSCRVAETRLRSKDEPSPTDDRSIRNLTCRVAEINIDRYPTEYDDPSPQTRETRRSVVVLTAARQRRRRRRRVRRRATARATTATTGRTRPRRGRRATGHAPAPRPTTRVNARRASAHLLSLSLVHRSSRSQMYIYTYIYIYTRAARTLKRHETAEKLATRLFERKTRWSAGRKWSSPIWRLHLSGEEAGSVCSTSYRAPRRRSRSGCAAH